MNASGGVTETHKPRFHPKYPELFIPGTTFQGTKTFLQPAVVYVYTKVYWHMKKLFLHVTIAHDHTRDIVIGASAVCFRL